MPTVASLVRTASLLLLDNAVSNFQQVAAAARAAAVDAATPSCLNVSHVINRV